MKRILCILVLLPLFTLGQQNLVPNGSFEEMEFCPEGGQWSATHWTSPNGYTPDHFHSCASTSSASVPSNTRGYQAPVDGEGYMGLWSFSLYHPEARDYIQTELIEPMTIGERYLVSFYASCADGFRYAISTLGAALTIVPPPSITLSNWPDGILDVEPQILHHPLVPLTDTAEWILVRDTFISRFGGERYLTIGNFHTDGNSDTLLFNMSAPLGRTIAYYYIDYVSVIALADTVSSISETEQLNFSLYPNPATKLVNIESREQLRQVRILDIRGREVTAQVATGSKHTFSVEHVPKGIYLLQVTDAEGNTTTQRLIKQ